MIKLVFFQLKRNQTNPQQTFYHHLFEDILLYFLLELHFVLIHVDIHKDEYCSHGFSQGIHLTIPHSQILSDRYFPKIIELFLV